MLYDAIGVLSALTVKTNQTIDQNGVDDEILQQVVSGGSDGFLKVWDYQHHQSPSVDLDVDMNHDQAEEDGEAKAMTETADEIVI